MPKFQENLIQGAWEIHILYQFFVVLNVFDDFNRSRERFSSVKSPICPIVRTIDYLARVKR
jgi:hypothetical protein